MTNTLLRNISPKHNISHLAGKAADKRALVLYRELPQDAALIAKRFFHTIITVGEQIWHKDSDLHIITRNSVYIDGRIEKSVFSSKEVVYCINTEFATSLKNSFNIPNVPLLLFSPSAQPSGPNPHQIGEIHFGLSVESPGEHVAAILGYTTVMSTNSPEFTKEYRSYTSEVSGYMPKNLIRGGFSLSAQIW